MIQPAKTGKDIRIMIWGAIILGDPSDLVIMQRDEASPPGGVLCKVIQVSSRGSDAKDL
jgi:hypothetical protein